MRSPKGLLPGEQPEKFELEMGKASYASASIILKVRKDNLRKIFKVIPGNAGKLCKLIDICECFKS